MKHYPSLTIVSLILFLSACSNSVTNVWDYYVKNNVEKHQAGTSTVSKSKVLYRKNESVNKAQLELVAFKQDSARFLVIGSHKIAKAFYIYDSVYHFDVNNLYSHVRGNDFIRQLGDLTIFFAHIPAEKCQDFLNNWGDVKNKYMQAKPAPGETMYIDYSLSPEIFLSFPKTAAVQEPKDCILWVGRRKHEIATADLQKALADLKTFN